MASNDDRTVAFRDYYGKTLGSPHKGFDYWLKENPDALHRYGSFANTATPSIYEESKLILGFPFLLYYSMLGYEPGVRSIVAAGQRLGLTKSQLLEGISIAFLLGGPRGMETIARALRDYQWIVPNDRASFPEGWAADPGAFNSGLDFSNDELSPTELQRLESWYERTLGEVPRHVHFLSAYRPALLKIYRNRFENCLRELPKQCVPTTLLHYDVIRGYADGIRENVLLARGFGVSKEITLTIIASALVNGGMEATSTVDRAVGDIFDRWDQGRGR